METKTNPLTECEIKASSEGWSFEGYASKFGGVDSYNDMIHKGAYESTLQNRKMPVFMRYEHKAGSLPPGKWVDIREDDSGLFVKGELTEGMSISGDIRAAMRHGTLSGLSIGYSIPKGGSEENGGIRHLKTIDLVEISIVQNPADTGALVTGMKAEIEALDDYKDFECFLRDVGNISVQAAKCYVSRLKDRALRDVAAKHDEEIAEIKKQMSARKDAATFAEIIKKL